MKSLQMLTLLLALAGLPADATQVYWPMEQIVGQPLNLGIVVQPRLRYQSDGTNIYVGLPIHLTPVAGQAQTNLYPGLYDCTVQTINKAFTISVTNSAGPLNAAALIVTAITNTDWLNYAYPAPISDVRYQAAATNGPGVAGWVLYTDGGGNYYWAAPSGGGGSTNTASATATGLLVSNDWSAFNAKAGRLDATNAASGATNGLGGAAFLTPGQLTNGFVGVGVTNGLSGLTNGITASAYLTPGQLTNGFIGKLDATNAASGATNGLGAMAFQGTNLVDLAGTANAATNGLLSMQLGSGFGSTNGFVGPGVTNGLSAMTNGGNLLFTNAPLNGGLIQGYISNTGVVSQTTMVPGWLLGTDGANRMWTNNGAGLTNLNASNISSGTVPSNNLPALGYVTNNAGTGTNETFWGSTTLIQATNQPALQITNAWFNSATAVPAVDITATWNNASLSSPTLIRGNATNTASTGTPLLIDLQVGGVSKIKVNSSGSLTTAAFATFGGSIVMNSAGSGLSIRATTNCKLGSATLVNGTVTVSNTAITANSVVFFTLITPSGTIGTLSLGTVAAGTSFVVNSVTGASAVQSLDQSTFGYLIVEKN